MWSRLLKMKSLIAIAAALSLIAAVACASEDEETPAAATVAPAPDTSAPAASTAPAPAETAPVVPEPVVDPGPDVEALGYTPYTAKVTGPDDFPTRIYTGPRPTKYTENPTFAELVKAGQPCVEQVTYADWTSPTACAPLMDRLPHPDDIGVFTVPQEIGVYGGTKRLVESGATTLMHHASSYSLFVNDYNTVDQAPFLAKGVEASADGRTYTTTLRRGVKWSDGKPVTMDDFIWVWEDLNYNKERYPKGFGTKDPITGNPVKFDVVDDNTFTLSFDTPYYTFLEGKFSGTPYVRGSAWFAHKPWASQWVPKYNDPDELQAKLDAFGVEDWIKLIVKVGLHRAYYQPWIGPFVLPPNGELWNAGTEWGNWRAGGAQLTVANPYFWAVDPHGQQLPYLDAQDAIVLENREAAIFRFMNGESDGNQSRGFQVEELPMYNQNMVEGDYSIGKGWSIVGNDSYYHANQDFMPDTPTDEWARLLRTRDFRTILSIAQDRQSINEVSFLGLGVPQNHWPHPSTPYAIEPEWRTLDIEWDLSRATEMMEKLGYTKDEAGFWLRKDGTGILEFEWFAGDWQQTVAEVTAKFWKGFGIDVLVHPTYGDYGTGVEQLSAPTDDSYGHSPWWIYWFSEWPIYGGRGVLPCAGQYFFTGGEEGCSPSGADANYTDMYGNMAPAGTYPMDMSGNLKLFQDLIKEGNSVSFFDPRRKEIGQTIFRTTALEKYTFSTIGFGPVSIGVWRNNLRNVPTCCAGRGYGNTTVHYFEDGMDNMHNPGNKSKKYKSWSFARQ